NIDAFNPEHHQLPGAQRSELDRWILSELQQTIREVTHGLDQYDTSKPAVVMQEFLEHLSNWYLRRSRERSWKTALDNEKLAAYLTLYECLTTFIKLPAPVVPFATEERCQSLVRTVARHAPCSLPLSDWAV